MNAPKNFIVTPLSTYQNTQTFPPITALKIAIRITEHLQKLHTSDAFHGALSPNLIAINSESQAIEIPQTYTRATTEQEKLADLTYLAPEQTGRLNRKPDTRCDLYAVGAILYELLTHRPMFGHRPAELILHAIMTELPPSPETLGIPLAVSNVVMRLLAKDPDSRYQTASGLLLDLVKCQTALENGLTLELFALGAGDLRPGLGPSRDLYGRSDNIAAFHAIFANADRGATQLVAVSGPPGIGKTTLCQGVISSVQRKGSVVAIAKCDHLRRHLPYNAWALIINQLIKHATAHSDSRLQTIKDRLKKIVATQSGLVAELFPDLTAFVGVESKALVSGLAERENRLRALIAQILRVFLSGWRAPVMLLDDLQWADDKTLSILPLLCDELRTDGVVIVTTFRSTERSRNLDAALLRCRDLGVSLLELAPAELSSLDITQLIEHLLECSAAAAAPLAELAFKKTAGNPLAVQDFLRVLRQQNFIRFSLEQQAWTWNLGEISELTIATSSIEFWRSWIGSMESTIQRLLGAGACLGQVFDELVLVNLTDLPASDVSRALMLCLDQGILRVTTEGVTFAHDCILEAAYRCVSAADKDLFHFRSAQILLNRDIGSSRTFDLANHINAAGDAALAFLKPKQLAEINASAARRARAIAAYPAAVTYFSAALRLAKRLEVDDGSVWQLNLELAECLGLSGDIARADAMLAELDASVTAPMLKTELQRRRVEVMLAADRSPDALDAGQRALTLLGLPMPINPGAGHLALAALRLQRAIGKQDIKTLKDAPEVSDTRILLQLRILIALLRPAFYVNKPFYILVCLTISRITLLHGSSIYSAIAYIALCAYYSTFKRNLRAGYEYGQLAENMLQRFPDSEHPGFVAFAFAAWSKHFFETFAEISAGLRAGHAAALAGGDMDWASYCAFQFLITDILCSNTPLQTITEQVNEQQVSVMLAVGNIVPGGTSLLRYFVNSLRDVADSAISDGQNVMDEASLLASLDRTPGTAENFFFALKIILSYLHGDLQAAIDNGVLAYDSIFVGMRGHFIVSQYCLFFALALIRMQDKDQNIGGHKRKLKRCRQAITWWGRSAGNNFSGDHLLLEAEVARSAGNIGQALELFDQARARFEEKGLLFKRALVAELTAQALRQGKCGDAASDMTKRAAELYARWGANKKAASLGYESSVTMAPPTPVPRLLQNAELTEFLSAARTISGKVVLDQLLPTLNQHLARVAGAQRSLIFLVEEEGMVTRADTASAITVSLIGTAVDSSTKVPTKILRYVEKTLQPLCLDDASQDSVFGTDSYIQDTSVKSILCVPMLQHGQFLGLAYLENNHLSGSFTALKQQMVILLCAQGAISLQNAALYKTLGERVEQRSRELLEAQRRLAELEKAALETQMAGGFAHEMRNILGAGNLHIGMAVGKRNSRSLINIAKAVCERFEQSDDVLSGDEIDLVRDSLSAATDQMDESLRAIDRCLQRGLRLVDQVLIYAYAGTEQDGGDEHNDFVSIIEAVVSEIAVELPEHITIQRNLPPRLELAWPATHLTCIVRHLVRNARDALAKQSRNAAPQITLTLAVQNEIVTLSVLDNGCGMTADVRKRIFEPFFSTKGTESTGLGLAVVKKIVTVYAGKIECDSKVDTFTKFTVSFPIRKPRAQPQTDGAPLRAGRPQLISNDPW